jgi:hypothetical protein
MRRMAGVAPSDRYSRAQLLAIMSAWPSTCSRSTGNLAPAGLALLVEAGLIEPATTIVTTVHAVQVVDDELSISS